MKHASLLALASMAMVAHAQPSGVLSHQKISDTEGGFTGILDDLDRFGTSVASLGDLDGDGVGDLVVGAIWDDDGGTDRGAVWVLFLNECAADIDADGDIDAEDFFDYLDLFASGDDRADIDGDGDIDGEDFNGYLDLFAQGC